MLSFAKRAVAVLALSTAGLLVSSPPAAAQNVGKSTEDLPNLCGMFAIHNRTGKTIHYQVKWGNEGWTSTTLPPGRVEKHWYPLDGNGRAPKPSIRFDGVANGHRRKVYHLRFKAVGYTGYGPGGNLTEPKRYHFRYSPDGSSLDLYDGR